MPALPALRPLDVFPVQRDGRELYCLRDTQELSDKVAFLTPRQLAVVSCLDGRSELHEVQARFTRRYDGLLATAAEIEGLVEQLDEIYFLDSPRFREQLGRVRADFAARPTREAAFRGAGYAAEPEALDRELRAFFEEPGPGLPRGKTAGKPLAGLVAPHIDFRRGGTAYAWAYRVLLTRGMADLYVVIGVAHVCPPTPFALTLKDFETPFGPARAERELGEEWARRAGGGLLEHELSHRREHSAEFQAVWLSWAARRLGTDFRMLPILAANVEVRDGAPAGATADALEALAETLNTYPGRVCLLAGADLAHVGPRFGDDKPAPELIPWMEAEDAKTLRHLAGADAAGFHRSVTRDGNKRKVCGLGSLFSFLWLLERLAPRARGSILRYGHAPDPSGGEVSFVSAAFTRP